MARHYSERRLEAYRMNERKRHERDTERKQARYRKQLAQSAHA
jgi:hypothetical protein